MEDKERISVEDALRLENNNLRKTIARLQAELVAKDEAMLFANLRAEYDLDEGDEINPQTLEIVRKQKPEKDLP